MAITAGNVSTETYANSATSYTHVHNNNGTVLVVLPMSYIDGSTISVSGITYNGVAMTHVIDDTSTSVSDHAEIWVLTTPANGSNNVVVTYNTAPSFGAIITAVSYTGVDLTTPIGATAQAASDSQASPVSTSITMASGSVAISGFILGGNPTVTPGSGQNSRTNADWGGEHYAVTDKGDATAMSYTYTGGAVRYAHVVAELLQAVSVTVPQMQPGLQQLLGSGGMVGRILR